MNEYEEGKDDNENKSENLNEQIRNQAKSRQRSRKKYNLNKGSQFNQQISTTNIDDEQVTKAKLRSETQIDIEEQQDNNNVEENNKNNDNNYYSSEQEQNEEIQDQKNQCPEGKSSPNYQRNTRSKTSNLPNGSNNLSTFNTYRNKLRVTPEKHKLKNASVSAYNFGYVTNQQTQSSVSLTTTRSGRTVGSTSKY